MDGFAAVASAIIALIALGVSIVVAVNQIRIAREQTSTQQRLTAIEEARRAEEIVARSQARVTASTMSEELRDRRGRNHWLVLRNQGAALARNVEVDIDQDSLTPAVMGLHALPMDLQPGQSTRFPIEVRFGDRLTVRITVRWVDEDGEHARPYTLTTM